MSRLFSIDLNGGELQSYFEVKPDRPNERDRRFSGSDSTSEVLAIKEDLAVNSVGLHLVGELEMVPRCSRILIGRYLFECVRSLFSEGCDPAKPWKLSQGGRDYTWPGSLYTSLLPNLLVNGIPKQLTVFGRKIYTEISRPSLETFVSAADHLRSLSIVQTPGYFLGNLPRSRHCRGKVSRGARCSD
jgi:hypothetical protein